MRGPIVVAVIAVVLVAAVFALRPAKPPKPDAASATPAPGGPAAPAAGPLWPMAVGHTWVYSETSPERPGAAEVSVVVSTEERTGFRLVEERGAKDHDTDTIEVRDDGYYHLEYESSPKPLLLLPARAPAVRDWTCDETMRASVVRETEFTLDGKSYPAFEVRYERKDGEIFKEYQTLTFAPGLGIVRKDTTAGPASSAPPRPGRPTRYVWELVRFKPGKTP